MGKAPDPENDKATELALEQARAALALTAADMGEFEWDMALDLLIISDRMAKITGMAAGAWPGRNGEIALDQVHPDDREALRTLVMDKLIHEHRYTAQYRTIRPGAQRIQWMESSAVILRGPDGAPVRLIGVVRDISARKVEEEEREALVAELDHRVKNVLASVQSLAAQSARKTVSLESFLKTFTGRLEAMAAAHTLLTRTRWRGAEIGDVVAAELSGLAHGRARWSGPVLTLSPRATNTLALALHELATNAVKYGALSTETGRLEVRWSVRAAGGFELTWTERRGPPVEPPTRQGFGAMLLEQVTGRELGGAVKVEFLPEGLSAVISADGSTLTEAPASRAPAATNGARQAPEERGASRGDEEPAEISGLRVLVVEDAVLLALELEAALIDAGALVLGPAASIEEALAMLDQEFDVALLDADLNGRSAAPIAEALRARAKPFIIATGHKDGGMPDYPSVPVIRKPYNVRQIALALSLATSRAGSDGG